MDDDDDDEEEEEEEEEEKRPQKGTAGTMMMQEEEHDTGAIKWDAYREYFTAAHGAILVPPILLAWSFTMACAIMSAYWLVYWEEHKWHQPTGFYIGIYVALGISQSSRRQFYAHCLPAVLPDGYMCDSTSDAMLT